MATVPGRLTIDDFEQLPQELAENHELIDGELVSVSGNTLKHNYIQGLIFSLLWSAARHQRLGIVLAEQEYDFGGNAHAPDVSFFGPEKQRLQEPDKRVQRFVPDLAIEVVSENDLFNALMRKKDRYRRCGTAEVWLISPQSRELFVFSDQGDAVLRADDELATGLIPGFRIKVSQLFETD